MFIKLVQAGISMNLKISILERKTIKYQMLYTIFPKRNLLEIFENS